MRTERILAFVLALGLLAGVSCAAHSEEGARAQSKEQSANVNVAGDEKKVTVSAGDAKVEVKKSGDENASVTIGGNSIEVSKSTDDSEEGKESSEDVVKISGMNHNHSYECKGRSFSVEGTSNTVTLTGQCQDLRVAGTSNHVDVEGVASINVSGIQNQVTYERGVKDKPPSISKSGINNSISKKGE